jgi:hypothetical protein
MLANKNAKAAATTTTGTTRRTFISRPPRSLFPLGNSLLFPYETCRNPIERSVSPAGDVLLQ